MSLGVTSSAIAVQTQITVRALLASESVSLYWLHHALVACYVLMDIALDLKLNLHLLDSLKLFLDIISEELLISSQHFYLGCETGYAVVVLHLACLQHLLAAPLAYLGLALAHSCMVLEQMPCSHEVTARVGTEHWVKLTRILMRA